MNVGGVQRGELLPPPLLLLALVHKEEVVKLASVDLVGLQDKEFPITHKDPTVDRETEPLLVGNRTLRFKVLVAVVLQWEEVNLQLPVPAQLNRNNSNNRDQSLPKTSEPDLSPLKLVHRVPANLLTPNKADLEEILLGPRFRMHLSGGKHFQLTGKD